MLWFIIGSRTSSTDAARCTRQLVSTPVAHNGAFDVCILDPKERHECKEKIWHAAMTFRREWCEYSGMAHVLRTCAISRVYGTFTFTGPWQLEADILKSKIYDAAEDSFTDSKSLPREAVHLAAASPGLF
uniref:Uncharacterized protein n=1 Tax=Parascaris equorum TaxID=6256 RepID=A0A914RF86_PAREQ